MAATRRGGNSSRSLEDSVDRLTEAFERLADRFDSNGGPSAGGDRLTNHIRRYMPFYALATVWALMLLLLPTRSPSDGAPQSAQQVTSGLPASALGAGSSPSVTGATGGAAATRGGGRAAGTQVAGEQVGTASGVEVSEQLAQLDPLAWNLTGVTKGGFNCEPGVRQMPWSAYAVPCFPAWDGGNPGDTYRGVSEDKIIIVRREFPSTGNQQAVDAFIEQAGFASRDVNEQAQEVFVDYFNQVFELWGREVEHIIWESEFGDSTEEAQSRGKEGACADADVIVNELNAYGVVTSSHPFGECAAERGLVVFRAGAYYPETWYRQYHPYLWHGLMECERIAHQVAEYVGKRLAGKNAEWAKGAHQALPRYFGTYVPNNEYYQHCVKISRDDIENKWGGDPGFQYNYTLDVSRFPDEAARAIVQFNAEGVTTIILACDPISVIFLTQAASNQNYFPEWMLIGVAATDTEGFARLWDQEAVRGSLFGMSQLGDLRKILGPEGELVQTYKVATGTDIPEGATGRYFEYLQVFNFLQATGPNLNPHNMADAAFRAPPGGAPRFEVGYTSYQDGPDGTPGATSHTGVDDSREVYWLCTAVNSAGLCTEPEAFDGGGGVYVETYNGQRFRNNEWPAEEPPIYPDGT